MAFTAAYAVGLFFMGRFIDKVGTRIGYAIVMGIWSLSAMAHALAFNVVTFAIARAFLGLGESGNFPAAIKTVAEWFPRTERSLATGIFNSGTNMGAILAPVLVPLMTHYFGWRAGFLTTGAFSAAWIVWWVTRYRPPTEDRSLTSRERAYIMSEPPEKTKTLPWASIIGYRQTWAFSVGKFLTDPVWWLYLFWLPKFFSSEYHLNLSGLTLPLIVIYCASAVGSIYGGNLSSVFARSMPMSKARKAAMLVCAICVVPVMYVVHTHSMWVAIGLLSLAAAAHQGWSANLFTTPSDMFPRSAIGAVVGIGGMLGSVGGVLFQELTGIVLQKTHSYMIPFLMASSAYLLALLFIHLLAPGLRKVEFSA
jgi:MFS transporter, ACS family, hexuronate transporter